MEIGKEEDKSSLAASTQIATETNSRTSTLTTTTNTTVKSNKRVTFAEENEVGPVPNSFPIHIDDDDVHDFDFSYRKGPVKYATRRNFIKRVICLEHLRESMALREARKMNDATREVSSSENNSPSLATRVSSIFGASQVSFGSSNEKTTPPHNSTKLQKKSSKQSLSRNSSKSRDGDNTEINPKQTSRDTLPDTRPELEARLNYHLAELDRLKRLIQQMNNNIRDQNPRYQCLRQSHSHDMDLSVIRLGELLKFSRDTRNSYGVFVAYHRREIERISEKRVALDIADGIEPRLPEIYTKLDNDYEWMSLFLV